MIQIMGTLHEERCTFMIISRSVLVWMRNVLERICRESQKHILCPATFFWKSCLYEIMWKNTAAPEMPQITIWCMYTPSNKNPSSWYFVPPAQAVTCGTVSIIIQVILLNPYIHIRGISLSSIHYNQSHRIHINWRQQYIWLIWN